MTEEVKIQNESKENNELLALIVQILVFLIMGTLFMTLYLSMLNHIGESSRKRLEAEEAKLSESILNQCKKIAKSQERTVAGGMTVHSSYWGDYRNCIRTSVIHKEQYGKEDIIQN
jgi:flagellar biosynthesis protein FlhB